MTEVYTGALERELTLRTVLLKIGERGLLSVTLLISKDISLAFNLPGFMIVSY